MTSPAQAGDPPSPKNATATYSVARLAAVQALYQIMMSGESMDHVVEEFLRHRLGETLDETESVAPKSDLFVQIVRGTCARRAEIDDMIAAVLSESWSMQRLETVLRCILEAGVYELLARDQIPARVAISEYVDLADAFYSGAEPGMVNGILDRLARKLRPSDFGIAEGE